MKNGRKYAEKDLLYTTNQPFEGQQNLVRGHPYGGPGSSEYIAWHNER